MAKALKEMMEVRDTTSVTYQPLDIGDPHMTVWNGLTFHANVPKELERSKHADMIETARGNPWFSVDGKSHKRVKPDREPVPAPGADSEIGDEVDDKKMVEIDE